MEHLQSQPMGVGNQLKYIFKSAPDAHLTQQQKIRRILNETFKKNSAEEHERKRLKFKSFLNVWKTFDPLTPENDIKKMFEDKVRKQAAEGKMVKPDYLEKDAVRELLENEILEEDQRQMKKLSEVLRKTDDKNQNQLILLQLIHMTIQNNLTLKKNDDGQKQLYQSMTELQDQLEKRRKADELANKVGQVALPSSDELPEPATNIQLENSLQDAKVQDMIEDDIKAPVVLEKHQSLDFFSQIAIDQQILLPSQPEQIAAQISLKASTQVRKSSLLHASRFEEFNKAQGNPDKNINQYKWKQAMEIMNKKEENKAVIKVFQSISLNQVAIKDNQEAYTITHGITEARDILLIISEQYLYIFLLQITQLEDKSYQFSFNLVSHIKLNLLKEAYFVASKEFDPMKDCPKGHHFILKYHQANMMVEEGICGKELKGVLKGENHLMIALEEKVPQGDKLIDQNASMYGFNTDDFKVIEAILKNCAIVTNNEVVLFKNQNEIDLLINLWDEKPTLVNDVDQYYQLRFNDENWENAILDQIEINSLTGEAFRQKYLFDHTILSTNEKTNNVEELRVTKVEKIDFVATFKSLSKSIRLGEFSDANTQQHAFLHQYPALREFNNCRKIDRKPFKSYRLSDYEIVAEVQKPMQQFKMKYVIILNFVGKPKAKEEEKSEDQAHELEQAEKSPKEKKEGEEENEEEKENATILNASGSQKEEILKKQMTEKLKQSLFQQHEKKENYNFSQQTLILGTTNKNKYAHWRAVLLKYCKVQA
ncbi:hypothetical protein FGO68_gene3155 [Halteria grandinella]|uniref:Uncharacterized protein n=1 Tax=Halteria grandinella TaxID=5974 RepID=A0A8J8NWN9_HALGN|nr:hypothetical protein FGO68_gene3155 [Halteria grandinella]